MLLAIAGCGGGGTDRAASATRGGAGDAGDAVDDGGGEGGSDSPNVPSVVDLAFETDEDLPLEIVLSATAAEGGLLNYLVVTEPGNGTLVCGAGGAGHCAYTPAADYFGSDAFEYKVNDGTADSNEATVSLTIHPINDPPEVTGQSIATLEDNPVSLTLSASDVDPGTLFTYQVSRPPDQGSVVCNGASGECVYTPAADYNGEDSFTFTAGDNSGWSNDTSGEGLILLTVSPVNDPPLTYDFSLIVREDSAVSFTLGGSDPDGGPLVFTVTENPAHGLIAGAAPNLTYTPGPDYSGMDGFLFSVSDGSEIARGVATITVQSVNDPPAATASAEYTGYNGGETVQLAVEALDVDGDYLRYSWGQMAGDLTLSLDHEFSTSPRVGLPESASGAYTFRVMVTDGRDFVTSDTTIQVTPYGGAGAVMPAYPFAWATAADAGEQVAVIGSYLHLMSGDWLKTYSAADLSPAFTLARSMTSPKGLVAFQSAGLDYLAAAFSATVDIFDASTGAPAGSAPTYISSHTGAAAIEGIAAAGDYLYLARGSSGVTVLDVTDPAFPATAGTSAWLPGTVHSVAISGSRLYAGLSDGLAIADISTTPWAPSQLGSLGCACGNLQLAVAGSNAYGGEDGLVHVYDVTSAAAPLHTATLSGTGGEKGLQVAGSTLFGADAGGGLYLMDISAPSAISVVERYYSLSRVNGFGVGGGSLFMATGDTLLKLDISNVEPLGSHYEIAAGDGMNGALEVMGGMLLGVGGLGAGDVDFPGRMRVFDIGDPGAAYELSSFPVNNPHSIKLKDWVAYMGRDEGFDIVEVMDPAAPLLLGGLTDAAVRGRGVDLVDNYLFLADAGSGGGGGLAIYDVSYPATLTLTGVESGNYIDLVALHRDGAHAYVGRSSAPLLGGRVINTSDKSSPADINSVNPYTGSAGAVHWIATAGERLYTTHESSLELHGLADPLYLGGYNFSPITPLQFVISGNQAYLGTSYDTLMILDVTQPDAIRLTGLFPGAAGGGIAINGGILWSYGQGRLRGLEAAPSLDVNYLLEAGLSQLAYTVSWHDPGGEKSVEVLCYVTGGSCTAGPPSQSSNTAAVSWQLPAGPGDHEILIVTGNNSYFLGARDRVKVQ